jgi:hypothetical protein
VYWFIEKINIFIFPYAGLAFIRQNKDKVVECSIFINSIYTKNTCKIRDKYAGMSNVKFSAILNHREFKECYLKKNLDRFIRFLRLEQIASSKNFT